MTDGLIRCPWSSSAPEFPEYHDTEWGFPVADDRRLFEKLCLEGFQSGLSWRTILVKRDNFRAAFHQFDFRQVAEFGPDDVERLLNDAGIVRHRGKIEAVINNAQRAIELVEREGSLATFFWQHEPDPREVPQPQTMSTSPTSIALSKQLKKLGWKFIGPTTMFAFFQAMGMLNDHTTDCYIRPKVTQARADFTAPRA